MTRAELLADLYPDLKRVALGLTKRRYDAEELLQSTMCKLLESNANLPNNRTELRKYCVTALYYHNKGKSEYSKERAWRKGLNELAGLELSTTVDLSARIDNEVIDRAIDRLPELERRVFLLYAFDDFSYKKTAAEIGISAGKLFEIVGNAKTMIRQWVTKS